MNTPLLTNLTDLPDHVIRPDYTPSAYKNGIVHLGLGAFHRSHQAFYTDAALASSGGDWRILGVSMRDRRIPALTNAQHGLYNLIVKNAAGPTAQVIGSISGALSSPTDTIQLLNNMCSPDTRIVSLTVTEKGYGIDRVHGGIDQTDTTIVNDLERPEHPKGVLGLIVRALRLRRTAGIQPFTVLCCDNLPNNGQFLKQGIVDFAQASSHEFGRWISDNVPFPCTMVDRITPAQSPQTLESAIELSGHRDLLAIEAEPFHQWVIEDTFSDGRPDWESAGALFTTSVAPFEEMKLRMLNGAHSMLAYGGFLADKQYVRDVMLDVSLTKLVTRHLQSASSTLCKIPGIDFNVYASNLLKRFSNPEIDHGTSQIASDGSQKMPQRIFDPALTAIERDLPIRPFAFATALWMHYCKGTLDSGSRFQISDPIATRVQSAARNETANDIVNCFNAISGLIPPRLAQDTFWHDEVVSVLKSLGERGVRITLDKEAERP